MFLLGSFDAIERSKFEDLIKKNLHESGYTDYSYYTSQSWSNHSIELRKEKLYELGFIGNYELIGYSTLGNHQIHKRSIIFYPIPKL